LCDKDTGQEAKSSLAPGAIHSGVLDDRPPNLEVAVARTRAAATTSNSTLCLPCADVNRAMMRSAMRSEGGDPCTPREVFTGSEGVDHRVQGRKVTTRFGGGHSRVPREAIHAFRGRSSTSSKEAIHALRGRTRMIINKSRDIGGRFQVFSDSVSTGRGRGRGRGILHFHFVPSGVILPASGRWVGHSSWLSIHLQYKCIDTTRHTSARELVTCEIPAVLHTLQNAEQCSQRERPHENHCERFGIAD